MKMIHNQLNNPKMYSKLDIYGIKLNRGFVLQR